MESLRALVIAAGIDIRTSLNCFPGKKNEGGHADGGKADTVLQGAA